VRAVILLSVAALVLWLVMFSPWTAPYINFWLMMTLSATGLAVIVLFLQRKNVSEVFRFKASYIGIGIVSAFVLYLVFLVGNAAASKLFSFAQRQISDIYDLRAQSNSIIVGIFLFFFIGPGEEIFWRGFIQQKLVHRQRPLKGFLTAALIYGAVHLWTFNFILFITALICGLFWGFIYMRYRSVWPGIISHALWDVSIFILLPVK
jgi:membrane protease YdiL (CAAX protease family)